jgi:hypothetical protein
MHLVDYQKINSPFELSSAVLLRLVQLIRRQASVEILIHFYSLVDMFDT